MLGELLYESATIAYDTGSKQYVNPTNNVVYGPNPPSGGWPIIWYQDPANGIPITPVNTTETAAQIAADLAAANVQPTTVPITKVNPSWFAGTTFGVSNMLLVGGAVVVGFFILKGK